MYTMNQLTIIGFTGREAETHYTANGTLITTLSVAAKEFWKDASGAWQSRTEWHRAVLYSKLAEYSSTLAKGSLVMVQGSVRTREYEKDGTTHRVTSSVRTVSAIWIEPNAANPMTLIRSIRSLIGESPGSPAPLRCGLPPTGVLREMANASLYTVNRAPKGL